MSATGDDRSMRKIAALAAVGMVVLALGIAGGSATYAYLSDSETLGTADDPNVIAAGNIASGTVTSHAGNTGTTGDFSVQAGTETDPSAGTDTTAPTDTDTETETMTESPVGTDTTAPAGTETETTTDTATETDSPTETESESDTEPDTDIEPETETESESDTEPEPDTDTEPDPSSDPGPDEERSCTGNTGTGAGNAGDDCTTASGLAVFGVPALAAVRREYALPVSSSGR